MPILLLIVDAIPFFLYRSGRVDGMMTIDSTTKYCSYMPPPHFLV